MYERVRADPADAITIVDGTFYQREWQVQFETFLSREDVRFVHGTTSVETCLKRNRPADPTGEQGVHVIYRAFDEPDMAFETAIDELVTTLERG